MKPDSGGSEESQQSSSRHVTPEAAHTACEEATAAAQEKPWLFSSH